MLTVVSGRQWWAVLSAAFVVACAGVAWTGVAASRAADADANRAAAQAEVARLLGLIVLPPGLTRSASEPVGDGGVLAFPSVNFATPNLIDVSAWWTTTLSPEAVIAYFTAHRPPGTKPTTSGQSSTGLRMAAFGFDAVPGVMSERDVAVTAVPLTGGGTGVRSDGEAIWLTPRPPWEQIPSGVARVMVTARGAGHTSTPLTLTGKAAVRLASFINRLDVVQPRTRHCPVARNESVRLTFRSASGGVLAAASEQPSGCAFVSLTIRGRAGLPLSDYPSVTSELLRIGAIPMCAGSALRAAPQVARSGVWLTFTNTSRAFCRVHGTPRMRLFNAVGHRVNVLVRRESDSLEIPLSPGDRAMSTITSIACGHIARVTLSLPGIDRVFGFRVIPRQAPCRHWIVVGSLFPDL